VGARAVFKFAPVALPLQVTSGLIFIQICKVLSHYPLLQLVVRWFLGLLVQSYLFRCDRRLGLRQGVLDQELSNSRLDLRRCLGKVLLALRLVCFAQRVQEAITIFLRLDEVISRVLLVQFSLNLSP